MEFAFGLQNEKDKKVRLWIKTHCDKTGKKVIEIVQN